MRHSLLLVALATIVVSIMPAQIDACETCEDDGYGHGRCVQETAGGLAFSDCRPCGDHCHASVVCKIAGCFLEGSLVETPAGQVSIELLRSGDVITSVDENGNLTEATVTRTYRSIGVVYYVINGSIKVTAQHPFMIDGAWVTADQLKIGDNLITMTGDPEIIESIETVDYGVRVYNIEVSGSHTFFVDGILVHNKGPIYEG